MLWPTDRWFGAVFFATVAITAHDVFWTCLLGDIQDDLFETYCSLSFLFIIALENWKFDGWGRQFL